MEWNHVTVQQAPLQFTPNKTKSSGIFTGTDFYVETLRTNNNAEHYWRDKT